MVGRGGTWCLVKNCTINTKHRGQHSLFLLPKQMDRCTLWLQKIGRLDLLGYNLKHKRICSRHFERIMFLNDLRNRLHAHAVPTLFLPADKSAAQVSPPEAGFGNDVQHFVGSGGGIKIEEIKVESLDEQIESDFELANELLLSYGNAPDVGNEDLQRTTTLTWEGRILMDAAVQTCSISSNDSDEDREEEIATLRKLCSKYFPKELADMLNAHIALIGKAGKGCR